MRQVQASAYVAGAVAAGGGAASYVLHDTFDRANGTLIGTTPDVGGTAWNSASGASFFTITDNQLVLNGSAGVRTAFTDVGAADVTIEWDVTDHPVAAGSHGGVIFNSNGAQQWRVWLENNNQVDLYEVPFGFGTLRGRSTAAVFTLPFTLTIVTAGDSVTVSTSLGHLIEYTAADRPYKADTQIGVIAFGGITLDNLRVTA